ncbi:uncharacterized protein BDV17DRAFT_296830 [Aspergillus undulatus]|uniref:uncharacterized protein n=1 Tax=Aspergillus undulatus TaxID=1810928 RepID=UPI003CCE5343
MGINAPRHDILYLAADLDHPLLGRLAVGVPARIQFMVPIPASSGANITLVQPRPGFLLDEFVVDPGLDGFLLLADGGSVVLRLAGWNGWLDGWLDSWLNGWLNAWSNRWLNAGSTRWLNRRLVG